MVIVVHLLLAVVVFVTTNWLGSHSRRFGYIQMSVIAKSDGAPAFNFVFRVLTPLALITLAAAGLQLIGASEAVRNVHLAGIWYVLLRVAFSVVTERGALLNWWQQALQGAVIIVGSYGVGAIARSDPRALLPNPQDIGNELWLLIALFTYKLVDGLELSNTGTTKRKADYVERRFYHYRRRYGRILDTLPTLRIQPLAYAILIYESFNRPRIYRAIERDILFPLGLSKTLGVMQIETRSPITDWDSVRLGAEKIHNDFLSALVDHGYGPDPNYDAMDGWVEHSILRQTVASYNRDEDYISEVLRLYHELRDKYFSGSAEQLEIV